MHLIATWTKDIKKWYYENPLEVFTNQPHGKLWRTLITRSRLNQHRCPTLTGSVHTRQSCTYSPVSATIQATRDHDGQNIPRKSISQWSPEDWRDSPTKTNVQIAAAAGLEVAMLRLLANNCGCALTSKASWSVGCSDMFAESLHSRITCTELR